MDTLRTTLIDSYADDIDAFQRMLNGRWGERNAQAITSSLRRLWEEIYTLDRRAGTTPEELSFETEVHAAVIEMRNERLSA